MKADTKTAVDKIYFDCKHVLENLEENTLPDGTTFYIDEDNETLQIKGDDGEWKSIYEMDDEEASIWVSEISAWLQWNNGREQSPLNDFEKRIGEWYSLTADCERQVKSFLKKYGSFDIDLPNDFYFIISLERKVVLQGACLVKDNVMVKVSYPLDQDSKAYDWHDTMISWDDVCQDPVILSDFMHEFYAAVQNMED